MQTEVWLEGVDGSEWILAGPRAGAQGVHLGTGVQGLYDAPVQVVDQDHGTFPGAHYVGHKFLKRELVFGVEILHDGAGPKSWMTRDSAWRKAWAYDKPATMYVRTQYGTRYLKVWLSEQPEVEMETDPNENTINRCVMTVVAYDPFWYEEPQQFDLYTQLDTTLSGSENLVFDIQSDGPGTGVNPTDLDICPQWALQHNPSGNVVYTIPDYSFERGESTDVWTATNPATTVPHATWTTLKSFTAAGTGPLNFEIDHKWGNHLLHLVPETRGLRLTVNGTEVAKQTQSYTTGSWNTTWKTSIQVQQGDVVALQAYAEGTVYTAPRTVTILSAAAESARRIVMTPITPADGDVFVDTDRRTEQVTSRNKTPIWARMNGVRWKNKIPAWTESMRFVVTVSGAPVGTQVTLFLPRPWSRPWGLW